MPLFLGRLPCGSGRDPLDRDPRASPGSGRSRRPLNQLSRPTNTSSPRPFSLKPFPAALPPKASSPTQESEVLSGPEEERAARTEGGPQGPPQVQPTSLGSPSPPFSHSLPSCSLRLGTSLFGHRRR